MNLDFQAGNSPLASRQNPVIYAALLVALVIIAVCALIWILILLRKKQKETPEWIEAEKKRPTKYSDIVKLAKIYAIAPEEIPLLWDICKKYHVPNIFYSIKQFNELDPVFKQAYTDLKDSGKEQKTNRLFALKFKLDKIFAETVHISSTTSLQPGTKISLLTTSGTKTDGVIRKNEKNYLAAALPSDFLASPKKPEPLKKIAFTFHSPTGMIYICLTRIIRYEQEGAAELMILAHSSDLIKKTRRSFKRKSVNEPCRIAPVKLAKDKNGSKTYRLSENTIPCTLLNISGGGCLIASALPIKDGQIVCTEFDLPGEEHSAIGKIVRTRKSRANGMYNLHIHFLKISLEVQNKILAKVYSYD